MLENEVQQQLDKLKDELRRVQGELNVMRTRYFDLYDLAPVGYVAINEQNIIIEANLTFAILLGDVWIAFARQTFTKYIYEEDQQIFDLHRKQLVESGKSQSCELRMVKNNGSELWVMLETAVHESDEASLFRIVISDITDRKLAEAQKKAAFEALQLSEMRYLSIIED